jgi:hypothetical protein
MHTFAGRSQTTCGGSPIQILSSKRGISSFGIKADGSSSTINIKAFFQEVMQQHEIEHGVSGYESHSDGEVRAGGREGTTSAEASVHPPPKWTSPPRRRVTTGMIARTQSSKNDWKDMKYGVNDPNRRRSPLRPSSMLLLLFGGFPSSSTMRIVVSSRSHRNLRHHHPEDDGQKSKASSALKQEKFQIHLLV